MLELNVRQKKRPITPVPFGYGAYTNPIYVGGSESDVPVIFSTGSSDNNSSKSVTYSGIDLESNS